MKILAKIAKAITDVQYSTILSRMEVNTMTYKLMKRIIQKGGYDKEATMQKLDVFLMADRITIEEYQELVELMGGNDNEE